MNDMRWLITLTEATSNLTEGFFKTTAWRWSQRSKIEYIALFTLRKVLYTVSIFLKDSSKDQWDIAFTAETKTQDFGYQARKDRRSGFGEKSNARTVFGTVIEIARTFIGQKHPTILTIENDMTERTRFRVNMRLATAMVAGLGYSIEHGYDDIDMVRHADPLHEAADNAARLERAREMGFNTNRIFYHSTTGNFDQFDLAHAGQSNTVGTNEPAIFLTDHPGTANSYIPTQFVSGYQNGWTRETYQAAEHKMHDLYRIAHQAMSGDQGPLEQQRAIRQTAKAEAEAILKGLQTAREQPYAVHQSGSNIMPVFIRTKRLMVQDMGGRQYDPDTVTRYLRMAKRRKKDGVAFLNYYDWGGAPGTLSRPQTTVAIFDPKNVRSIFANFDPTQADSANLSEANDE